MIRRRGFTLIEAVVSLAIVAVVLTTLFQGAAQFGPAHPSGFANSGLVFDASRA